MTILIKGMEMPVTPEDDPYVDIRIFADGTAVTSKSGKPFYTQYSVVFLPPHGRLIDADELLMDANKLRYGEGWLITVENIEAAPTVIEAEK